MVYALRQMIVIEKDRKPKTKRTGEAVEITYTLPLTVFDAEHNQETPDKIRIMFEGNGYEMELEITEDSKLIYESETNGRTIRLEIK